MAPRGAVYIPADLDDMAWLVRSVPAHEDIHMVGLGSNLLVRDGGVKGVVILLAVDLNSARKVN